MTNNKIVHDVAVIGLGRFGSTLALRLTALGKHVLGCDQDADAVKALANDIAEVVILNAQDENALQMVGITAFNTVIVALTHDFEDNALVTTSLKKLGVPNIICVADSNRHREILTAIGANRVIVPQEETAIQLAEELSSPGILEVLPLDPVYRLMEIKTPSGIGGKTVKVSSNYDVSILLVIRKGELIVSPEETLRLEPDDILVVVGEQKNLIRFSSLK